MSESKMDSAENILELLNEIKYFKNLAKGNLESLKNMKKGTIGVIDGLQSYCNEIQSKIDEIISSNFITHEYKVKLVESTARKLVEKINQAKIKHDSILIGIENLKKEHENNVNKDESKKVKICNPQEISKDLDEVENLINDCIHWCKSIKIISDTRNEYDPPTDTKPAYVVMFVNLKFQGQQTQDLDLQPDIKAVEKAFNGKPGFKLQKIDDYKNLKKEDTLKKIEELKSTDFGQYSCLIIIYDSHGKDDGKLVAVDNESVEITGFWEACDQNPTLLNKPIIIIIDTCRGKKKEPTNTATSTVTKSTTFHRFHPEKHNFLIVFATSDDCIAQVASCKNDRSVGSHFLTKYLKIRNEKPNWDILAQIALATKRVIDNPTEKITQEENLQNFNQTVTYVSLLPRQFRLSGAELHNWSDVEEYKLGSGKVVVAFNNEDYEFKEEEKQAITNSIHKAGFQIAVEGQTMHGIDTLIIISHGFQSDSEIHKKIIPSLQQTYSYINTPSLTGMPKVFFNLGTSYDQPKKRTEPNTNEKASGSKPIVTENSDILSYCDRAADWCEAICDVIEKSPGNPDGLVRLLTEAMRRPKALASKYPPHIQSSLRFKLVLPSQKKSSI